MISIKSYILLRSFGGSYRFVSDPPLQYFVSSYIEKTYIDGGFRIVKLSKK